MTGKHPRLRHHSRTRKSGKVVTYYFYDMRIEGKPDIPLGCDFEQALKQWDEIHNRRRRIAGTVLEGIEAWEREALPTYASEVTRRNYRQNLKQLKAVFGVGTWDNVTLAGMRAFLKKRTAKTQANRELSCLQVIWSFARREGYTDLPWPAAGMERSKWKNEESAREFEVTEELFNAVYAQGDQVLQDCMDLASATAMRLTDCRTILLPKDDVLRLKANKTGKKGDFDVRLSEVLPALLARRRATKADHLMLLSTPDGRKISPTMLRDRYELARQRAALVAYIANDDEFARSIKAMFLRDMRKYSADLAEDEAGAQQLLQHSSASITRKHYRTKAPKLKPAR